MVSRWAKDLAALELTALVLLLHGCTAKKTAAPVAVSLPSRAQKEYVDLQAGWRLQIVAPITTGKVFEEGTASSDAASRTVTMKASTDLVGYETAFWELDARPGGGVRLRLASALMTKEGIPSPISTPTQALLHVTKPARFLRLFYLIRKSESDHEMVIAGADRADRLELLTDRLKAEPVESCRSSTHIYCEWIPYGMAVRPEMMKSGSWAPIY